MQAGEKQARRWVKSKMDGRRKNGRDGCFPMDGGKRQWK